METDKQIGGGHYTQLQIQPDEYAHRNGLNFMQGNAIKYITRYKDKNGKEDLLKAISVIQKLIEFEYPMVNGGISSGEAIVTHKDRDVFNELCERLKNENIL